MKGGFGDQERLTEGRIDPVISSLPTRDWTHCETRLRSDECQKVRGNGRAGGKEGREDDEGGDRGD